MNRVTFTVVGYILLLTGFLSIILGMIGLSLKPLSFLETSFGPLGSFLFKMLLIIIGMIMFYMSRVPYEDE